jgi:hypothetical protein
MSNLPYLGFGLGLRPCHYQAIIETKPAVDWFEIITEDFLVDGGNPLYHLDRVREHYPVVMHGVSLSIGGTDPLDEQYLSKLKQLADRIHPAWVSDHLCWTGVNHINLHDLMPLPYTEEALVHVAERVSQVQDYLGRPLILENPSSYITYCQSVMTEWEFFNALMQRTGCLMLLDINNVYVSARNHAFSASDYINQIAVDGVQQYHLAGHLDFDTHIVDTHDQPIIDQVWQLYAQALRRFKPASTLIERDENIPPLAELLQEVQQARDIAQAVSPGASHPTSDVPRLDRGIQAKSGPRGQAAGRRSNSAVGRRSSSVSDSNTRGEFDS